MEKTNRLHRKDARNRATGTCFMDSFEFLTCGKYLFFGTPYLVHGIVWHEEVGWHSHGWVEDETYCYDFINGELKMVPKWHYYKVGKVKIRKGEIFRYAREQAIEKAIQTGLYYFSKLPCKK